jgi:hypothetical protein
MHVKGELVDGTQLAKALTERGNDDGRSRIHGYFSNRVIPSAARNLALIFLPRFKPKQSSIPCCARNDTLK